jgi:adenylate cyclase
MFTDMVAYTALGQKNEQLALSLLEAQRGLLRPIFKKHRGREVKTMGDAFLVEFPSALEAVRCSYDIQRSTREFNLSMPTEQRLHIRIGVHLGDIIESQDDILGDAVNVASRMQLLAEDGGVCLSRQVFDHVHNKLDVPIASMGPRLLKNVKAPVEVYKIQMPWEGTVLVETSDLDKRRVAVLPLKNMSSDPDDEYFADGITEELMTTLSGVRGLTVIARTSTMQYKNSLKRASDIGKELKTGTLIEGSVRRRNRGASLGPELRPTDGRHLRRSK